MDPKLVLIGFVALLVIGVLVYAVVRPKKTGPAVKVFIATVNQQTNSLGALKLLLPNGWVGDTFTAAYYDAQGNLTNAPAGSSPIWSCVPSTVAMTVPETEAHSISVLPVGLGVALLRFSDVGLVGDPISVGVASA